MRKLKPVLVVWDDIVDGGGEWTHPETADPKPVRVRTVGFLKASNKTHIVVARDFYDQDGRRIHGGLLAIPHGCIVSMVDLTNV